MDRLFKNSWKRIERAKMHGEALAREWTTALPKEGQRVDVKQENDGAWVASFLINVPPDNNLALEVGEFFYQLRSSLDGAIWQAVTIGEGTEPTTNINRLDFPICSEERYFNQSAIHKHKLPQNLKNWLASIQPYCAEKPLDDPDRGLGTTLQILHNLARMDRHRRLRVVAAVPSKVEWAFNSWPPANITSAEGIRCNFLEGESKFLRFTAETIDGQPIDKIQLATGIKIEIAVDEIPCWEGTLDKEFVRFVGATHYVIQRFEEFFA
ncbi:MAG: hypothetical protein ACLQM6_06610 [Acidobacteriaceae bacterium]